MASFSPPRSGIRQARVARAARWIVAASVSGSLAALLGACINLAGPGDRGLPYWEADNRTDLTILMAASGTIREVVSPRTLGLFTGRNRDLQTYVIKAYVFLEDDGEVRTTRAREGTRVVGGRGELVYCEAFSWTGLEAADFNFTVERNVAPETFDALADPCPTDTS